MRGLKGKVVVVTGGGSGIGRAVCRRFVEEQASVVILDINSDGAAETARLISDAGGRARSHVTDISDYDAVEAAIAAAENEFGPIDVLVNNAGWDEAKPFLATDTGLWKKIIDINLYGPLNLHHTVVSRMATREAGKVINVASDAGRVGSSGEAVYSACKGGLIAFSKTLARELARKNIQINTVCPGPTDTPLFASFAGDAEQGRKLVDGLTRAIPMRRLGQPSDYPGIIAFLASADADYITGQTISVSGGLTMHG
ncbi:MAG: glucose 1-dehydrogenase [Pseudomonadota bacterium]